MSLSLCRNFNPSSSSKIFTTEDSFCYEALNQSYNPFNMPQKAVKKSQENPQPTKTSQNHSLWCINTAVPAHLHPPLPLSLKWVHANDTKITCNS